MFNLTNTAKIVVPALALLATAVSFSSHASVTPDRTRLVFNESDKSISVTLRNNDPTLPYLAQSWIEDAKGNKISSPLAVLPPVQRIDAMMNLPGEGAGAAGYQQTAGRPRERVLFQRARNSAEIK